jgi:hypothetical protein
MSSFFIVVYAATGLVSGFVALPPGTTEAQCQERAARMMMSQPFVPGRALLRVRCEAMVISSATSSRPGR